MKAEAALRKYFGYKRFRPGQKEIVEGILKYQDVLAVMPTGAGKSICYQVPAMLLKGITIVVSPLISLMQDQVKALKEAGIPAAYINSSLTEAQNRKALMLAAQNAYKIIYVAPERLETHLFRSFAMNAEISMVTIDEAHCISQWGQDFRPSYLKIVDFIDALPIRPIISAFTATATEEVKEDIRCILKLNDPLQMVTGFDRPNLYFEVIQGADKDKYVLDYVRKHKKQSGIIYCSTRKNTEKVAELINAAGIRCAAYHAGLDNETRKKNQEDFVYDRISVIAATNAFGMGIDKSNVRFVIHYNMPSSMENYYQEAGRAGRDGEDSRCILLYSARDVMIARMLLDNKDFTDVDPADIESIRERDMHRLHVMENYCRTTDCLRNYILQYFGEETAEACGHCGSCDREVEEKDVTFEAKWILNCVSEARGRYGANVIIGTVLGLDRARLRELHTTSYHSYGQLKGRKEKQLKDLIVQMINLGYLTRSEDMYAVLGIGERAMELRDPEVRVIIRAYTETEPVKEKKAGAMDQFTSKEFELFERLRTLRMEIARENGIPPYIVFNDKTLIDMCLKMPVKKEEMLNVNGVASAKYQKYGSAFLKAIKAFVKENK